MFAPKFIIIEGPDGAGKTAFAEKLSKYYDMPITHLPPPKPGFKYFEEYQRMIENGKGKIFDRFFYSQLVYGPIKRGETVLTDKEIETLETSLFMRSVTIYYLSAQTHILQQRCIEKREDFVNSAELAMIAARYAQVFSKSTLPIIRIDTSINFPIERV